MKRSIVHFFVRRLSVLLAAVCCTLSPAAQQAYFVDGFHGGVYGHYPLPWYTDFMVNQLEQHPEWCINLELEPETWDSVKARTPEAYERFRRAMGQGRIEVVNPSYAQPYLYNISGESIIRQFQYGMRRLREHFPKAEFLVYSSEEPCFTSALPQLLRQLGFRYVVLKNPDTCWGGYVREGGGEFVMWEGPDGSVLPCVPRYDCEALESGSTWQTTAWKNSAAYLEACRKAGIRHPVGMCLQDAGWKDGPWLGEAGSQQRSQYILWSEYFRKHLASGEWPRRRFTQDDFCVALMWGSPILQRVSQRVRREENRLVQAEKLAAIAGLENGFQPDSRLFDRAWHSLMLSQHHDSWIVPYNQLRGNASWADMILGQWGETYDRSVGEAMQSALQSLGARREADSQSFILVFNTTAQSREEQVWVSLSSEAQKESLEVKDANGRRLTSCRDGNRLSFLAQVPAFGFATYCLAPSRLTQQYPRTQEAQSGSMVMENRFCRMELDLQRGGTLNHLVWKGRGRRELIAPSDSFRFGELRGYLAHSGRICSSASQPVRLKESLRTPFSHTVTFEGEVGGVPFTKRIVMREDSPLIDVFLSIGWRPGMRVGEPYEANWRESRRAFYDTRFMLSVLFPTTLEEPQLSKDAPFDVCESRQPSTRFNTWDSIRHNVILHWVDLSSRSAKTGLTVFSDHTTSYTYAPDYPLALTLQYAGPGLWGRNYSLTGPTSVHYSFCLHEGDWEKGGVHQQAEAWQEPLIVAASPSRPNGEGQWLQTEDENLLLTSASYEDGTWRFRLYNASSSAAHTTLHLGIKADVLNEEDLAGNLTSRLSLRPERQGSRATISLPPFGIRTYRVKVR